MPSHTECCTCHAKSSQQTWRSDAPNSSDEDVSCTAPATENASLQIFADRLQMSHACHRFWKYYKTLTFCSRLTRCTIPCACRAKRHLNLQKWSEPLVFLRFWLWNVLRATTSCTFSTSQIPKVVRTWCVLHILTSKCASRHNGVHFFISHLARWLHTRRFSEPTFQPSRATNHWKNTVFRGFSTFSRIWIFFLLLFSLLLFLFSLTLSISAFHLSMLSEVWLLNFLRWLDSSKKTWSILRKKMPCDRQILQMPPGRWVGPGRGSRSTIWPRCGIDGGFNPSEKY